jgi:uncharacterized protein (UPF0179 family)
MNRISSSRRLEAETKRNMEVKWLTGNLQPDFKTIAEKELSSYLEQPGRNDVAEVVEESIMDELADKHDMDKALLEKIVSMQSQIAILEKEKTDMFGNGYNDYCPNDPDAHLMKSRDGFIPACNVQTGTDGKNRMIVLAEVTGEYNDLSALEENHRKLEEQPGIVPEIIEADRGYANIKQIRSIESNGKTQCAIPLPDKASALQDEKNNIEFKYDAENDSFKCQEENKLSPVQKHSVSSGIGYRVYRAGAKQCKECQLFGVCTKSKYGRIFKVSEFKKFIEEYKVRLKTLTVKKLIDERKGMIEHVFGTVKRWAGKVPVLLTSAKKVQTEINIYATAYNLKRLCNIECIATIMQKLEKYDFSRLFLSVFPFFGKYLNSWKPKYACFSILS